MLPNNNNHEYAYLICILDYCVEYYDSTFIWYQFRLSRIFNSWHKGYVVCSTIFLLFLMFLLIFMNMQIK